MEIKQELLTLNGSEYLLDIEKAKELGLLKEKKDGRVNSWSEYVQKYLGIHGYSYNMTANMITHSRTPIYTADQLTQHEAKALSAFSQLLKLRRDWIGEWEPNWENGEQKKYVIECIGFGIRTGIQETYIRSLSFPTEQMVKDFRETFYDLIEEAKILI